MNQDYTATQFKQSHHMLRLHTENILITSCRSHYEVLLCSSIIWGETVLINVSNMTLLSKENNSWHTTKTTHNSWLNMLNNVL